MKKQVFYGITFHFENFTHTMDSDLLGEILATRFLSASFGDSYKRRDLSTFFQEHFPFIKHIVLYKAIGRKSEFEREFSVSEYIISKTY